MTVFCGINDVGKSNALRALRRFFDPQPFTTFALDYTKDPRVQKAKKKKAVSVTLIFSIPFNYSTPGYEGNEKGVRTAEWTVSWNDERVITNEIVHGDGSPLGKNSRIGSAVRATRLFYVPAIKDGRFFTTLRRWLHDALLESGSEEFRNASAQLVSTVDTSIASLLDGIGAITGQKDTLNLPEDLSDFFSALDFQGLDGVYLDERGDGLRIHQIPLLLKFICGEIASNSAKGRPKPLFLWAFEEPENCLEMTRAEEMRQVLLDEIRQTYLKFLSRHIRQCLWRKGRVFLTSQ